MTDFAMTQPFAARRRFTRPGRPGGVLGAIHYAGVLCWSGWPCSSSTDPWR